MNDEMANQPLNNEKTNNTTEEKSELKEDPANLVNPPDLINQPKIPQNPEELINNPAVAPQMLDDRRDLRVDLTND